MNLSDCAADHALGQALGSVKHLPHGLTIGLVVAETHRPLASASAPTGSSASPTRSASRQTGRATARAPSGPCAASSRQPGFPTLRDVGVTEDDLPALVESAMGEQSYNLDVDCHDWTAAEVEQAFRAGLALEVR